MVQKERKRIKYVQIGERYADNGRIAKAENYLLDFFLNSVVEPAIGKVSFFKRLKHSFKVLFFPKIYRENVIEDLKFGLYFRIKELIDEDEFGKKKKKKEEEYL